MRIPYMQCSVDSLVFYFIKSKKNQTGELSGDPWYMYSNLNNPSRCPITAFTKYLFSNTNVCHFEN